VHDVEVVGAAAPVRPNEDLKHKGNAESLAKEKPGAGSLDSGENIIIRFVIAVTADD
jgi:hypothetical protein